MTIDTRCIHTNPIMGYYGDHIDWAVRPVDIMEDNTGIDSKMSMLEDISRRLSVLEEKFESTEAYLNEAREKESWEMIDEFLRSFKNT